MKRKIIILLFLLFPTAVFAQNFAIKNNLVYDATMTPNLGFEIALSDFSTIDISGGYNPFTFKNGKSFKHWLIQPEYRMWFCEKFNGGFWGVHLHGSVFRVSRLKLPFGMFESLRDNRYEGWLVGGGLSCGYHLMLGKSWGLEGVLGAGYAYIDYKKYPCPDCGPMKEAANKHYFGVTKLAISFVYIIR
ncbi:DUF3575 domain-containing protein [Alistipes sp. OttesenSCG-928-B03]|nr:DUF3575 domain-containing protein [Alistipes sp. OttesenSCG-928-B03]